MPWDEMTDQELLMQLPRIAQARDDVDSHLKSWVDAARQRGASWQAIGDALHMTRQSAWERFK